MSAARGEDFGDSEETAGRRLEQPDETPYVPRPAAPRQPRSTDLARDVSVHAEPWIRQQEFLPEGGDPTFRCGPCSASTGRQGPLGDLEELAENSVWDEPGTSVLLSGPADTAAVTWFGFHQQMVAQTAASRSWLVTLAVALVAGPAAILGTFWAGAGGFVGAVMMVVMGPTIEEIFKIALPLWIVEKRPWLFRSGLQVMLCAAWGGFVFAVVENLLYLNVYIPDPSPQLILWRWTVCVALHTGCSLVAAVGLLEIRRQMLRQARRPQLSDGAAWLVAAICIHGLYNAAAILMAQWF